MPERKKAGEESKRGGARPGAGRPAGQTKVKTSVSVDEDVLKAATEKWRGKLSPLVEKLLRDYIE
jgi:uncharacterized protein (DUF4415 family)